MAPEPFTIATSEKSGDLLGLLTRSRVANPRLQPALCSQPGFKKKEQNMRIKIKVYSKFNFFTQVKI